MTSDNSAPTIEALHEQIAQYNVQIEQDLEVHEQWKQCIPPSAQLDTDNHDRIAYNLLKSIDNHLGDTSDCRFHTGNVKVGYQDEFYYYPDAFVTCNAEDRQNRYIKRHPKLIAEVLSPSTQDFDRGDKFEDYQQIDALEEYLLISQDQRQVECRRRNPDDTWTTIIYGEGDRVTLTSIGLEFAIADLYRGLDD